MSDARKSPHAKLISIAAELVRGPNLDERFDLDDRLPKWVLVNIERICDRQRRLAIMIREESDRLAAENATLRAENVMGNHCRRDYPVLEAELRLARAVVEAAHEYCGNLGQHHYIRCENLKPGDDFCVCGGKKLWDGLRDYDAHVTRADEGETP